MDATAKIIKEIGHGTVYIPMGPVAGEAGRREVVRRVLLDGGSAPKAARAANVSDRTAWRVKADLAGKGAETLPLFETRDSTK